MVPEGQYTAMVYTAIKDGRFPEAVHLLTSELGVRCCCVGYFVSASFRERYRTVEDILVRYQQTIFVVRTSTIFITIPVGLVYSNSFLLFSVAYHYPLACVGRLCNLIGTVVLHGQQRICRGSLSQYEYARGIMGVHKSMYNVSGIVDTTRSIHSVPGTWRGETTVSASAVLYLVQWGAPSSAGMCPPRTPALL